MPDYKDVLNKEQLQAVKHTSSPLLIIAGAGTGKTTVITQKIAWLLQTKKAQPEEILALTFTEKASQEMEERVDQLVPYGMFNTWISTFHGFCDKILQNEALDIGISSIYRIINTTESWLLMRKHLYVFALDYYRPKGNPSKFIHAMLKLFSRLKDEHITPEEYLAFAEGLSSKSDSTMGDKSLELETKRIKETADAYFAYQQLLLDNNMLDFGDLIFYCNKLFKERPNVLAKYQKQFKYILVDEFQDTNLAQYNLIKLLSTSAQITVVGDDDQSIYKFRGASISNILQFKSDYPDAKEAVLTQNYRSAQNLLNTAYHFIQHNNPDRLEYKLKINKKLTAQTDKNGIIKTIQLDRVQDEIAWVVSKIKTLLQENDTTPDDIAILLRANRAAEPFIQALEQERIAHIFLASSGLYKQPIILDILSYTRVLFEITDSIALSRVLSMQTLDIPQKERMLIFYWADRKSQTFFEILQNIRTVPNLNPKTVKKIEALIKLIDKHESIASQRPAAETIINILDDLKLRQLLLKQENDDPVQGRQNIFYVRQLIEKIHWFAKNYDDNTLQSFLRFVSLEREAGDSGQLSQDIEQVGPKAVKILTVHSAKGLEFKYIFIPHMVQARFPTIRRSEIITIPDEIVEKREILSQGDEHIEEERRLFYVGLTRAKFGVFISFASDYGGKRAKKPSQFLAEAGLEAELPKKISNITTYQSNQNKQKIIGKQYPTPKEFSFSDIASYKKCPLQYKYQFVLKIPQDKGKGVFSFGTTMHNVLYQIFNQVKLTNREQTSLFGKIDTKGKPKPSITLKEIYKIYENAWIDDWYESKNRREEYYKAGKKILKEFFEKHKKNWPKTLFLERSFKVNISGNIIKGRIDRIDKIDDNKGVEIIDYKTGKYKEKLYGDDKTQLLIYHLAVSNKYHPLKLTYYFLDEKQQAATSFTAKEKDLEKTKQEISQTINQIKKSQFNPNPSEYTCTYCDFKNICPFSAV